MSKWTQRTLVSVPANGGTSASAPFPTPAAGNLLVAFAASATTLATPSGWTLADSSVTTGAAYLWNRTATGAETSIPLTLAPGNQPVLVTVFEFPAGTSLLATHDEELATSGVAAVGLAGMISDPKLLLHLGAFISGNNVLPAYGLSWDDPPANAITDAWYGLAAPSGSVAARSLSGYLEDSVLTEWHPRAFLDGSGLTGTSNRITAAFVVPPSLDPPVVTNVVAANPTTEGGTDGSITLTWSPVAGAGTYEVGIAEGINAESGFVPDSLNATSPHTIGGRDAGPYTWRVRAVPPE